MTADIQAEGLHIDAADFVKIGDCNDPAINDNAPTTNPGSQEGHFICGTVIPPCCKGYENGHTDDHENYPA